jgi:hypothetical protein
MLSLDLQSSTKLIRSKYESDGKKQALKGTQKGFEVAQPKMGIQSRTICMIEGPGKWYC